MVQDAFVLAVQKIPTQGNLAGWLVRTVDYLSANHRPKLVRRIRLAARWQIGDHANGVVVETDLDNWPNEVESEEASNHEERCE